MQHPGAALDFISPIDLINTPMSIFARELLNCFSVGDGMFDFRFGKTKFICLTMCLRVGLNHLFLRQCCVFSRCNWPNLICSTLFV